MVVGPPSSIPPPLATIVLGRPGLARDVVELLMRHAGLDVVDLPRIERGASARVVAVLVAPSEADWELALGMDASILVVHDDPIDDDGTLRLLARGANALLHADVEPEHLLAAVRMVGNGQAVLAGRQARLLLDRWRRGGGSHGEAPPALTNREGEILTLIESGASVRSTAEQLGISEKTVQNLQSRLFRKLGARNRAQAVSRGLELGLLHDRTWP